MGSREGGEKWNFKRECVPKWEFGNEKKKGREGKGREWKGREGEGLTAK